MKTITFVLKFIFLLSLEIFVRLNISAQSQIPTDINLWTSDIAFIIQKSEKEIPDFDTHTKKDQYINAVNKLGSLNQVTNSDSIVFELQRAFNLIGDEGTNIIPFQSALNLELLPIKAYWFNDGLYVFDAKNKEIIGEEVRAVNGIEIADLFKKIQPYISADNVHYQKKRFPIYAFMPRLLKHIGVSRSNKEITLEFSSGKKLTLTAEIIHEFTKLQKVSDQISQDLKVPKIQSNKDYWKSYLQSSSTLFIQLKKIENQENDLPFKDFIAEIDQELQLEKADKIILDLRFGGTGNGFKILPLVKIFEECDLNKNGSLFILISGSTKGPMVELASILEQNTKAILIGEPTGEGPNSVSDNRYLILKNTGLGISLTEKYWPTTWQFDSRKSIYPKISIQYNSEDYFSQKDPWIDAALNYSKPERLLNIPAHISFQLTGKYELGSEKLIIKEENGKVYLVKQKKAGSFFQLYSELNYEKEGKLNSNIMNVHLKYELDANEKLKNLSLNWKGSIKRLK